MNAFKSIPDRPERNPDIIDIILLLIAVMLLMSFDRSLHGRAIGIDFYQYWGVGQVIRVTDGKIRNPYIDNQDFNRILAIIADQSEDPVHKSVAKFRKNLELQGTPFSYFMFSWLPSEYNLARIIYRYWQMGLFILVVSVLMQAAGYAWWKALLTALLLMQVYYPMFSEIGVGNFNTTLMAGLAGALFIASKLSSRPLDETETASTMFLAAFLLAWAGLFALMKPTLIAVVVAFLVFLLARFGIRLAVKASFLSVFPLGLMAAFPIMRFHSVNIWQEWFHCFRSGNLDMLSLPAWKGNLSITLFISNMLHVPLGTCTVLVAVILLFSLMFKHRRPFAVKEGLREQLSDPHFALVSGVVIALGLFPLAWLHYFLLLLVPAIALLHPRHRKTEVPKLAVLSILLATPNIPDTFSYTVMMSWIPLWIAALKIRPCEN